MPELPEVEALAIDLRTRLSGRAIVRVDVERIARSCGYGVPLMEHVGEREAVPVPA